MTPTIEIPIIADGLPRRSSDDLARCVFLSVVADDPSPGWDLGLTGQNLPFLLLGLQGILFQPSANQAEFTDPDEIDLLINTIESSATVGPLTVETGIIWVPTQWLDRAFHFSGQATTSSNNPQRGDLFRAKLPLFLDLWRMTDNRLAVAQVLQHWPDVAGLEVTAPVLRYSAGETQVFAQWTARQFQLFPGGSGPNPQSAP